MPFLLLLVLTLICFQGQWPAPPWELEVVAGVLLTWLGVAGFALLAGVTARRLAWQLRADPSQRPAIVRRFARSRRYFLYSLLLYYVLALYFLGWGWASGRVAPGRQLALLAPLVAALVLAWWHFQPLEKALHEADMDPDELPFPGRLAYIALQARHNFLLVVPPLLLVLIEETAVTLFPRLEEKKGVMTVLAGLLVGSVFVGFPLLLRVILGLKRLPDSPLRDRLLATARRLNFRFTGILLWNTRGTIANAMVTGTVPFLRYVVLSDRLIEELAPDEIEAVFGHEIGHVKHHHMFFYLGFLLMSLLVLGIAWQGIVEWIGQSAFAQACREQLPAWLLGSGIATDLPMLLLFALYVFLVFGFLSRRCERQADVYGCRTASIPIFIEALEKVARLNGIHREKPGWLSSWQHSTIARRVAFLESVHNDPAQEHRFQKRVLFLKFATLFLLLGTLGGLCGLLGPRKVWAMVHAQETASQPQAASAANL